MWGPPWRRVGPAPWAPLCLVLALAWGASGNSECLQPGEVPGFPTQQDRFFFFNKQEEEIKLEESNRVSHKIVNRIVQILLKDVAGYRYVQLTHCSSYDTHNVSVQLDRIAGNMASKNCHPPEPNLSPVAETMVNMEVWVPSRVDMTRWEDNGRMVDAGRLGPQARCGWFVPTDAVNLLWSSRPKYTADFWKAYQGPTAKRFSLWGSELLNQLGFDFRKDAFRNNECRDSKDGMRKRCATLFAADRDKTQDQLVSQVKALHLLVDIVWLGDAFDQFIRDSVRRTNNRVMFYGCYPSSLIASGNFSRISFPEYLFNRNDPNHPALESSPLSQLTKVMWGPFARGAPEAAHIISNVRFSDQAYNSLLLNVFDSGEDEGKLRVTACQWVKNNSATWTTWLPDELLNKPTLYLAGLFPLTGRSWSQGYGLLQGARLALDLVNNDPTTLPGYDLDLLVADTECDDDVAISRYVEMLIEPQSPIVGILGPGCSDPAEHVASVSAHFHTLMVSYAAEAQDLSDRGRYPYFFRTVPPVQHYSYVYPDLFAQMGWTRVGALAEVGQELPGYHVTLQDTLATRGIELVVRRKFPNSTGMPGIQEILQEFKAQKVRVIIVDVFSHVAREIMCEAYKQKMTAYDGYVWFLPAWFPDDWSDVEYYNSNPSRHEAYSQQESVPCTSLEVERAVEGHFVLSKAFTVESETSVVGGITVDQYHSMYARRCGEKHVEESKFASFVYDAIWVYAKGLHTLLEQHPMALATLHTKETAERFRSAISQVGFTGVSGWIKFSGSDRTADLVLVQVFHNVTNQVGKFTFTSSEGSKGGNLHLDPSAIRWLSPVGHFRDAGEHKGDDCPIESFRHQLSVSCSVAGIIVISLVFVGLIILAVVVLMALKHRYVTKKKHGPHSSSTHERIKELGLLKDEYSHILVVDDWEISLDNLVINRELGQGEFGTVMGGEMYKQKEGWVAVAVKTLKPKSTTEEKLDFFSEVDTMKGLSHNNIVQLWGVCTRKEPMYAVMEFLLHGDLKTYLLSRRSLVGQGVKEAEDVRAANLTQMAVDVAQGLEYLHSHKLVHRDLACRNCLVHANKTVKIGDFGLTRSVNSTDYYRFTRKGMLPVRWTAPEALKDGIYSAKSDIWSYGVLVFEMVTFGSVPYQGLANREVLEHVASGGQLSLPVQMTDNLKSFIYWCMSTAPGYRPDLDDILSYFSYSPDFLSPCLDAPITSVAHEDSDSLMPPEMEPLTSPKGDKPTKRKAFSSMLGLPSLGKQHKSSVSSLGNKKSSSVARPSLHSSPSTSLCSNALHSTGLFNFRHSTAEGNMYTDLPSEDMGDNADSVFSEHVKTQSESELKDFGSTRTMGGGSSQGSKLGGLGSGDKIVSQHQSLGSDVKYLHSMTSGFELEEATSSGYLSESKQACQAVTSM